MNPTGGVTRPLTASQVLARLNANATIALTAPVTSSSTVTITNATDSTAIGTGSLVTSGGASFAKRVNINGPASGGGLGIGAAADTLNCVVISADSASKNPAIKYTDSNAAGNAWTVGVSVAASDGAFYWYDNTGSAVRMKLAKTSGDVSITSTTASSSTSTGSFVTPGGVGIGGALYVGAAIQSLATGTIFAATGASTAYKSLTFQNTSGNVYLGVESSVGGTQFTGSAAYDAVLYSSAHLYIAGFGGVKMGGGAVNVSAGDLTVTAGNIIVTEGGTGAGDGGLIAATATAGGNAGIRWRTGGTDRWSITLVGAAGAEALRFRNIAAGTTILSIAYGGDATFAGNLSIATGKVYQINGTQVVAARDTGWTAMTGSPDKATAYATSTVTLAQLAGRVAQLQASLTAHGLIGP